MPDSGQTEITLEPSLANVNTYLTQFRSQARVTFRPPDKVQEITGENPMHENISILISTPCELILCEPTFG